MFFGEPAIPLDDPRYAKRREAAHRAAKRFVEFTRFDDLVAWLQKFALRRPRLFCALLGAFLMALFALNISRMAQAYRAMEAGRGATEQQERRVNEALQKRHDAKHSRRPDAPQTE